MVAQRSDAMANAEHLAKLKQGARAWNTWRKEHPKITPNLRLAKLDDEDLDGANFAGANLANVTFLVEASIAGGDFTEADLREADLGLADLSGSKFAGARLEGASLVGANLRDADLTRADLTRATFFDTNLKGTNLGYAELAYTVFQSCDLGAVIGLDSVEHEGPSVIDIDTIFRSKGNIPEGFLRGAGVPDEFIQYMRSLTANPIEFYSCFISYSTKDQEFADRLYADLQNKGVRCWFAPHDVQGGKKLHEQIDEAIRVHDKLLLILSPHSMESEWVKTEIAKARKREVRDRRRVLFPIRLAPFETLRDWECFDADTGKDSAREIREYFIPDFSNWKNHDSYQDAFRRLMSDLKASDSKPK